MGRWENSSHMTPHPPSCFPYKSAPSRSLTRCSGKLGVRIGNRVRAGQVWIRNRVRAGQVWSYWATGLHHDTWTSSFQHPGCLPGLGGEDDIQPSLHVLLLSLFMSHFYHPVIQKYMWSRNISHQAIWNMCRYPFNEDMTIFFISVLFVLSQVLT